MSFARWGSDTESGAIETSAKAAPKPIRVTWHPMLHFDDDASTDWAAVAANGGLPFTVGAGVGQSFSRSVNSCFDDEERRSALASLRR